MSHIFISYSHKDIDYAQGLANNLHSMGFDVWIDERLDYGSQWPHEIQKQLDSCDAFILVMSPRSFASEWVQSELQRAKRKLKPIFPMLLEGDEPWLSVESTQFYDVRSGNAPDVKFYTALKRVVSVEQGRQTLSGPRMFEKKKSTAVPSKPKANTGIGVAIGVGALILFFAICVATVAGAKYLLLPTEPTLIPTIERIEPTIEPTLIPATGRVETMTEDTFLQSVEIVESTSTLMPVQPTATNIPPTIIFTYTPIPPTLTPSPTVTPTRNTSIYIEAENGKLGNDAYVENNSTASKSSFVNFSGTGILKFTLDDMKAGQYSLTIHYLKYANGNEYPNTGFQNLYVNNNSNPISIYYTKTFGDGDVLTWKDTSLTIPLEDGTNTLLISFIPGSVGASIDYIYLNYIE